jgi:hypothetical protein
VNKQKPTMPQTPARIGANASRLPLAGSRSERIAELQRRFPELTSNAQKPGAKPKE